MKIGISSFGAGASEAMIREIVERRSWMTMEDFSNSMSLTALIPGPFHVNLVTATGYRLAGLRGAILALVGFVFPGFVFAVLVAQGLEYGKFQDFLQKNPGIVRGILAAVAGLVISAVLKLSTRAAKRKEHWLIVLLLSALLWYLKIPFAAAVVGGGLIFAAMDYLRPKENRP